MNGLLCQVVEKKKKNLKKRIVVNGGVPFNHMKNPGTAINALGTT